MTMEAEPTVYGVAYSMANDPARTQTSPGGEMFDGLYEWMDSRTLSVNDTVADNLVNVTLVKLTPVGEEDVQVVKGQIPAAQMAKAYEDGDSVRPKSFTIDMMKLDGSGSVGKMKMKI